jgi:hypothetical protein
MPTSTKKRQGERETGRGEREIERDRDETRGSGQSEVTVGERMGREELLPHACLLVQVIFQDRLFRGNGSRQCRPRCGCHSYDGHNERQPR